MKTKLKSDIHLKPGELYIATSPATIKTVLGSCISMIFHCNRLGISGISHAQLPEEHHTRHNRGVCPVPCKTTKRSKTIFKYVTSSTHYMLEQFKSMKIVPREIEVKLFGGANVLHSINRMKTVGEKNIEIAHKMIHQYQLKLSAEDTGGNYGRTLYLFSQTGEVRIFTHKKPHP